MCQTQRKPQSSQHKEEGGVKVAKSTRPRPAAPSSSSMSPAPPPGDFSTWTYTCMRSSIKKHFDSVCVYMCVCVCVCVSSLQRVASRGGDHSDSTPQQSQWWILHLLQCPLETLHEKGGEFTHTPTPPPPPSFPFMYNIFHVGVFLSTGFLSERDAQQSSYSGSDLQTGWFVYSLLIYDTVMCVKCDINIPEYVFVNRLYMTPSLRPASVSLRRRDRRWRLCSVGPHQPLTSSCSGFSHLAQRV